MTGTKTGAEALMATAIEAGIEICLANPGTTEMPLVSALDAVPGIRPVLCLHENVATGAADCYARMAGKPAMTVLHLGPGLANGLTNLHNARRAHTPVVNVIGDHASWHIAADPPLNSPLEQIASAVSGFVRQNQGADSLTNDMAETVAASRLQGGQVATLIVPHDNQMALTKVGIAPVPVLDAPGFEVDNVVTAEQALLKGNGALYLGGVALSEKALRLAGSIATFTGAVLICETFFARMERGGDLPAPVKLPYFPEKAIALLEQFDHVVSVGSVPPVAFFGYPDHPSWLTDPKQDILLAGPDEDVVAALTALSETLGAAGLAPKPVTIPNFVLAALPSGALTPQALCGVIAQLQPENTIMMDEGLTVSAAYHEASKGARRFTHLQLTGGAIGMGPGGATGAALACPDRQVINLQADGSAAYSVQALWTQAREKLDVLTVILSNRSYEILNVELQRAGITEPGPAARSMASLDDPAIDWVSLAKGFGVPGVAVRTAEEFAAALERAIEKEGPFLIEAIMS